MRLEAKPHQLRLQNLTLRLPAPDYEDLQVAAASQPMAILAGDPGASGGGHVALSGNWVSPGFGVKRGYFPRSPLMPALACQPLLSQPGPPGPSLCFSQGFQNLSSDFWKDWLGSREMCALSPSCLLGACIMLWRESLTAALGGRYVCVHLWTGRLGPGKGDDLPSVPR